MTNRDELGRFTKEIRLDERKFSDEKLIFFYKNKKYNVPSIAKEFNVAESSIRRRLIKLGYKLIKKTPQENNCKGNLKHGLYVGRDDLHRGRFKNYNKIVRLYKSEFPSCEKCNWDICVEVHHIIPLSKDGQHIKENLISLCPNCHVMVHKGLLEIDKNKEILIIEEVKKNE